ncbi:MAG: GTPase HflX [Chlamydiae bacterium]|nr:GTPase HflX [Chlamydiota bacterium]MBI3277358.1 GTPase HflX [Chlamydiota bacterium]
MKNLQMQNVAQGPEKAILVGVEWRGNRIWDLESSIEELLELVDTAGARVVATLLAKIDKPTPTYFIGSGKANELAALTQESGADLIVFDDDLSPAQSRNLEKISKVRVIDRTQIILDIFSRRARTKEAQFQVELAQLRYLLPRLTGQWMHLSRQEGGVGTRGPGETQLEVDRRRAKTRILKLEKELKAITSERETQRKRREKTGVPLVSIMGYTNAGKTTLFNRLTTSRNLAEDRLFATLDATVRKKELEGHRIVLFSDTVGFIRKLPHHLVESFKATLEEVIHSDLLIHVVDISDPLYQEKHAVVLQVLGKLGAESISRMTVLNKIDLLEGPERILRWERGGEKVIPLSAQSGQGVDSLLAGVSEFFKKSFVRMKVFIPHQANDWVSFLYREAHVIKKKYEENGAFLEIEISSHLVSKILPFQIS